MHPIVIIGTGLAGYSVARELRKLDTSTPLVLLTADDGGFYSKPMLSNAFAQSKLPAQLVTQDAAKMATQLNAEIKTGVQVTALDTASKKVSFTGGEISYEKLVIAVGAQAIRLTIAGDAADEVLSVNHISDYALFRQRIDALGGERQVRVAILGAGLIGCEFANDLRSAGHAVTLIDPNDRPLAALAAPALSQGLHAALLAEGVQFHLGTSVTAINRRDGALQLTLADGAACAVDIVLSAVGLRADLRLAQAGQLTVGRGIQIDPTGRTSAADVYALGDCAEYTMPGNGGMRTLPYIAPIMTAARAIARTLTGQPTPIDLKTAAVLVKTPCYPLALVPPSVQVSAGGSWLDSNIDGRTISRFVDQHNVTHGFGVSPHDAAIRQSLLAELEVLTPVKASAVSA